MPAEEFGPNHQFLAREEILNFEEIERLVRAAVSLGVHKIRLTGGEPLLRRGVEDLVAMIAAIQGVDDIAITTNGVLLAHHAESLALAGLSRVTVSLDALNQETFSHMNGVNAKVDRVITGIEAARTYGLPVKINSVIKRHTNEDQILPLAHWALKRGLMIRFIEYMDVGETNGWDPLQVVPADEMIEILRPHFSLEPVQASYPGETARRWRHLDGDGEIGIISSISKPFCSNCSRLRVSADGQLFTCLFASHGHDFRPLLRGAVDDDTIRASLASLWSVRSDRYSELRGHTHEAKTEMSYLGG